MEFRVGDKVRVIGNDRRLKHFYEFGDVGFIVDGDVGYESVPEEKVRVMVDSLSQTVLADDLELVESADAQAQALRAALDRYQESSVNHPAHYNNSEGIECIEAIRATLGDEFPAYCKGNVIKYLWRYQYKNGIEDLKKAQVYLNWMVEYIEDNAKGA